MTGSFGKVVLVASLLLLLSYVSALDLTIASSGAMNQVPSFLDIYHSGDGGMYGELIRNRAFQGSSSNGQATTSRNTDYWTPFGGVALTIDTSLPTLSSSLPIPNEMDVPADSTGSVGFYNDGFWGFNVDATKRYIASLYMRGNYTGEVDCYFQNLLSGQSSAQHPIPINQADEDGWMQTYSETFVPLESASNPNNTFYFSFNGTELAGKSLYFNLFSVFKQTFNNRQNGLREDLAETLLDMNAEYIRMPGGNNMEGLSSPYEWKWNLNIGDLTKRPGRPGTWGDVNTDGLGLLEMMQWSLDMNLTIILGVWAGLYLDGEIISQRDIQSYVDNVMNELEFLLGDSSTVYGAQRADLGYPKPFSIKYVEIGNEDSLNGGESTYYSYRFNAFYDAIHPKYPFLELISTINPSPVDTAGSGVDLHIYGNEAYFASLFGTFDQASREYPVLVGEYAATQIGSVSTGQVGAQTMGMACAEAIFLLGCERNSDIVYGTSYGALIKNYDEEPGTVAVIKHTADEILLTISYYVQKLFSSHKGSVTLPVTASGGGFGPVYWSATGSAASTILKMVNYNGQTGLSNAISVTVDGSKQNQATLISLTAPNATSVNNLLSLGGEASQITTTTLTGENGQFSLTFTNPYEIVILVVSNV